VGINYSIGLVQPVTPNAGGGPLLEIVAVSSTQPKITEISLSCQGPQAVTASFVVGLVVPTTVGQAARAGNILSETYPTLSSQIKIITEWSNTPVLAGTPVYLRRGNFQSLNTNGGLLTWRFPRGYTILKNTSLVVYCILGTVNVSQPLNFHIILEA
jgi:hypothetical protein